MNKGNWIPISKTFVSHLPHGRAYTKLEAAYSLQVDYDDGIPITVAGYAALWRWSRGKVDRFLKQLGAEISYPENTKKRQNQNGQIMIQITDRSSWKKGQIRLIDSKGLADQTDRYENQNGQITDRSRCTTIDPEPNPSKYYCEFPLKNGTEYQVTPDQIETFLTAYPDVDLKAEFLKITAWCKNNKDKQKTRRGSPKFLNNWISGAQEKAAKDKTPSMQEKYDNQPPLEDLIS